MFLKPAKPEAPPADTLVAQCAVCGSDCIDMQVNLVTLCDSHFDDWLASERNPAVGGQVAMSLFVADATAKLRRSA